MNLTASSMIEALEMCKTAKQENPGILFRGQASLHPITSTLGRVFLAENDEELTKSIDRKDRFFSFLSNHPELKKYSLDVHQFYAIAQHYGLKTNYIDFSENPEVSIWFATNSSRLKKGDLCMIAYFDEAEFHKLTEFFQEVKSLSREVNEYPEVVKIDVDNLWRLQSQEGVFVYSPVVNFDETYVSCITKIVFPYESPYNAIKEETIYPKEKSRLEILIDQFFFLEEKKESIERWKEIEMYASTKMIKLNYNLHAIPTHESWKEDKPVQIIEKWDDISDFSICKLRFSGQESKEEIESLLIKELSQKESVSRKWELYINYLHEIDLSEEFNEIWNGIRNQHYPLDYVALSLTNFCYYWLCLRSKLRQRHLIHWEKEFSNILGDFELLQMESVDNDGSHGRFFISYDEVRQCLRDDLSNFFDESDIEHLPNLFLKNNRPQQLFKKDCFEKLFVTQIIPRQKIMKHNSVIFYSIHNLKKVGLA